MMSVRAFLTRGIWIGPQWRLPSALSTQVAIEVTQVTSHSGGCALYCCVHHTTRQGTLIVWLSCSGWENLSKSTTWYCARTKSMQVRRSLTPVFTNFASFTVHAILHDGQTCSLNRMRSTFRQHVCRKAWQSAR